MKHTPVEGAPHLTVAAPAFVPKRRSRRPYRSRLVPSSDGDGSNERRSRRASCFRNSGASKDGWVNCWEHPDAIVLNRLLHSSLHPQAPQKYGSWTNWSARTACSWDTLFHKLLSPAKTDGLQTRRWFVLPFGILVGIFLSVESVAIYYHA